jgi:hypothetical protein
MHQFDPDLQTLEAYRKRMQPVPSQRQMAKRLGCSWNTYLKYADQEAPRTLLLAAWATLAINAMANGPISLSALND